MSRVEKIQGQLAAWRPHICHAPELPRHRAEYVVYTAKTMHTYCRLHLPRKWRAFAGLGTVPSKQILADMKLWYGQGASRLTFDQVPSVEVEGYAGCQVNRKGGFCID